MVRKNNIDKEKLKDLSKEEVKELTRILKDEYDITEAKSENQFNIKSILKTPFETYTTRVHFTSTSSRSDYKTSEGGLLMPDKPYRYIILGDDVHKVTDFSKENSIFTYDNIILSGNNKREVNIFFPSSETLIKDIKKEFLVNKADVIVITDFIPLINNIEFVDLVLEYSIPFTTIIDASLAENFSKTLNRIANKFNNIKESFHDLGEIMTSSADKFAKEIGPKLDELEDTGFKSLNAKANFLNENGIKTLRGKDWTRTAVKNTFERWQKLKFENKNKKSSSLKPPKPE